MNYRAPFFGFENNNPADNVKRALRRFRGQKIVQIAVTTGHEKDVSLAIRGKIPVVPDNGCPLSAVWVALAEENNGHAAPTAPEPEPKKTRKKKSAAPAVLTDPTPRRKRRPSAAPVKAKQLTF